MVVRFLKANTVLSIGLVFLVFANLWQWFVHRSQVTERIADLSIGFFMGLAIGTLLLSIWMRRRRACQP
jgi:hypothetical protein